MELYPSVAVFLLCVSLVICAGPTAGDEGEKNDNYVQASIYMMSMGDWEEHGETFKLKVAQEANSYCYEHEPECGLKPDWMKTSNFTVAGFENRAGYPKYKNPTLMINFTLDLPTSGSNGQVTNYVLNKATLTKVTKASSSKFRESTGFQVIGLNGEVQPLIPDHSINKVLIPIAIILCIALVILVIILNKKCDNEPLLLKEDHEAEPMKIVKTSDPVVKIDNGKKDESLTADL